MDENALLEWKEAHSDVYSKFKQDLEAQLLQPYHQNILDLGDGNAEPLQSVIANLATISSKDDIDVEKLYSIDTQWEIVKRVVELCYFNHDLDDWAEELYEELTDDQKLELPRLGEKNPYIYDPDRRAVLQAELDAIFAHLYGLSTEDLRYILDPEDVCGEGCINETFRVLKSNELRQYGEYRTKRNVLEAWNKFGFDN